ncbi:glycosyltransferase [Pedobacter cryoconitis]|uniref:Glycosyltransferase involved in cell wall biosynthesis n=1 Tax=Pedobacter cryoconitis TaxID=188932 RepID=A0A7X0IZ21_9SPHI|nr:glycosyltransferase family A protein [Pedobacter cryoconitis]MBB6498100.1 glycosyltransferase involved in cell wall biosynthesis [Pedobacter cryoconitis]
MRPIVIPENILKFNKGRNALTAEIPGIAQNFNRLKSEQPLISIIIPAYNEEENILKTLFSLSQTVTKHTIEVIVVNNNSADDTELLANACQVNCITEKKQGITNARNAGLQLAKGEYILNADADTIYPATWIDDMVAPLINDATVCLTYGTFSFVPIAGTPRLVYFFYEYAADFNRTICKHFKEEALNVYGFNSACRRLQCLSVDGFNHPPGTNEDGWLAIKLREKGYGRFHWVTSTKSIVWTTDRRIQLDGGLYKATYDRLVKNISLDHVKKKS